MAQQSASSQRNYSLTNSCLPVFVRRLHDCSNPLENPEQTYKPIGNEVIDQSVDLITCLGGLHHVTKNRLDAFISSVHRKLRPGGVILMRDHDVSDNSHLPKDALRSIVGLVHTFVNASNAVPWSIERKEIRDFRSMDEWTKFMKAHNFTRISTDALILKNDPTKNGMVAFVKNPENLNDLRQAAKYRNDNRTEDQGRSTWIEWGNVRFSHQYAEFVQTHHSYAFDYIGHLRQHWQHFYHYISDCLNNGIQLKNIIFSDNFMMNLFILFAATIQCSLSCTTSIPNQVIAKWKYGRDWRNVSNLTDLEKYSAQVEKEYSDFINSIPFYMFDYIGKIKNLWEVIYHSQESWTTKIKSTLNGAIWSLDLLIKAAISAPIRAIYTSDENQEPETINVLIKDPNDELDILISRWEKEKDHPKNKNQKIEVVYSTSDNHKLVSFPRYRAFTQICSYLTNTSNLEFLEIGGQPSVSIDVILDKNVKTPNIEDTKTVYEMEKLQDPLKRRYVTYNVALSALKNFQQKIGTQNIEYIHE